MTFQATKLGWFRQRYEFTASLPSSAGEGFTRQLTLVLPGSIEQNSGGEVRGNTVVWDATNGGSLQVTSVGMVPAASRWLKILVGIAGAVVLLAIVLVFSKRRRSAPSPHCPACGAANDANARFCAKCGAATAVPAAEGE